MVPSKRGTSDGAAPRQARAAHARDRRRLHGSRGDCWARGCASDLAGKPPRGQRAHRRAARARPSAAGSRAAIYLPVDGRRGDGVAPARGEGQTPRRHSRTMAVIVAGLCGCRRPSAGGILTPGDAQTDPYRACLAFAGAARDLGASLHANSRAGRILPSREGVTIEVKRARVSAAKVIVATGYATPDFKRLLRRFRMFNTYVIATPRLSARVRRSVGLGDAMVGHEQAVSLHALDAGRPPHLRRRRSAGPHDPEQRAAPRRSSRARRHARGRPRTTLPGPARRAPGVRVGRPVRDDTGRPAVSAPIASTRIICSRWATAATG